MELVKHTLPLAHQAGDLSQCELHWAPEYLSSQVLFREAAKRTSAELFELPIDVYTREGRRLIIDAAYLGAHQPKRVIIHLSGTHGVEHPVGSAIQLDILNAQFRFPETSGVLWVHALNPFGAHYERRVDQINVDLNRNFILDRERLEQIPPVYAKHDAILNPDSEKGLLHSLEFIKERTYETDLKQALIGQYLDPRRLHFGGNQLSSNLRLLSELLRSRFDNTEEFCLIDVHTGLGPFGADTKLIGAWGPKADQRIREFQNRFSVKPEQVNQVVTYFESIRGTIPQGLHQLFPDRSVSFIAQEFGTMPFHQVLAALVAENFAFQNRIPISSSVLSLQEVFAPRNYEWRNSTLRHGTTVFEDVADMLFGE